MPALSCHHAAAKKEEKKVQYVYHSAVPQPYPVVHPFLAVPLVYPGAFSSASLICAAATVAPETAHNRLIVMAFVRSSV